MNKEIINILIKYPGLNIRDLCELNSCYSCIICADFNCNKRIVKGACGHHIIMTTEQWNNKKIKSIAE